MAKGFSDVLIGLQYGDEGKAKVIDLLAKDYDIVARFNGGANAGHTIGTPDGKGTVALNQIPSAIFHQHVSLYIGSGCVINLQKLAAEIETVVRLGIDLTGRLHISDQASVVQPHHLLLDTIFGGAIGTTKNGIGPCYADKAIRMKKNRLMHIRLGDLLDDPQTFFAHMRRNYEEEIETQYLQHADIDASIAHSTAALAQIAPFVTRDTLWLTKQVQAGGRVLFEGAQSVMLDITKGSVPYVTSSATIAGAAYVGGDLPPQYHRRTIGVAKAIMSRVGFGPFASEFGATQSEQYCMENEGNAHMKDHEMATQQPAESLASGDAFRVGIALRMLGNEYGTVSKRPRRVGMLDLVQLTHAVRMNGVDTLFLTKCDLLKDFAKTVSHTMPMITGYTLAGQPIDYVPTTDSAYRSVHVTIEQREAFADDLRTSKTWKTLPAPLLALLATIEEQTGCTMLGVGTGPGREEYVLKKETRRTRSA